MQTFEDDDDGYLAWVAAHPDGFVVNTTRPPTRSYLMLHRASCRTVSGVPARGDRWTADYLKVCSEDRGTLDGWARDQVGGALQPCQLCG